jgi:hypothetical protein
MRSIWLFLYSVNMIVVDKTDFVGEMGVVGGVMLSS